MPSYILNNADKDRLIEVSKIGMGHAATALSQIMGKEVVIEVPRLLVLGSEETLGSDRSIGVDLQIVGELPGNILILLPVRYAGQTLAALLGTEPSTESLTELEESALLEIGNILASAYLNAVGDAMKRPLLPSVPRLACDEADAILAQAMEMNQGGAPRIMVETLFSIADLPGSGSLLLIPAPEGIREILSAPETS